MTATLCHHFDARRCRSCSWLGLPYDVQLEDKQRQVAALVGTDLAWEAPVASAQLGFRNKAKMVVTGTADEPVLGILRVDRDGAAGGGVDLRDCPLHTPGIQAALPLLADFVRTAALTPYDVPARRGELKHLLVTESPDGGLMVRFVLRSQEPVARIRKHLAGLQEALPALVVASVNLQPEHKAVLEGEREIVLTERETLLMRVAGLDLHLRPQSFFQTNTAMAAELYERARAWTGELAAASVWDLYCGVGGFALSLARPGVAVTGIEVSREAVASASLTAAEAGLADVRFEAGDATAYALGAATPPDLVVVNPPRRGIGPDLSGWLGSSDVDHVLYSSCNAATLATDLAAMPSLRPVRAQLLDMFPNTSHYEVLVLLERR
ncbi:23S rRNA methyltransferase [Nocardioides sp. Root1257]|uniref:23S rRNA (uracil(747)-C(5))-methyltransferase RlmC n=1 Tax=unclassified Nocardioides TaxID=2615069 RepID=UPI0006F3E7D9|nr:MULTISPECIES: 23S rRNA (uracil(747)-C(5))-methyltransferase RlmC [unclassified Nocardioides]KQW49074.1 23S rRNA methyltransferase [Nocardioides sp. Root1257]KRC48248.1 23S rRNA methyltransferase [Nocardioides sp. Root224]